MARKTHEQFIQEMQEKMPHIKVLGTYEKSNVKVKVQCEKCSHIWESRPSNLLHGFGCPSCAGTIKKTHEQFVAEIDNIFHGEYKIIGKYENNRTKIKMLHVVCGKEFEAPPTTLLKGHGCPHCNGGARISHEDFIKKLNRKYPDKFEILSLFETGKTTIQVKGKKCGHVFNIRAADLLNKGNCPVCYEEKIIQSKINNREKIHEILGTEYEIINDFTSFDNKVVFKHIPCGTIYDIYPSALLANGHRCLVCYKPKNTKTHEEFMAEIMPRCAGKIEVIGKYQDSKTKILVKHLSCGTEYFTPPSTLMHGSEESFGCPNCYHRVAGVNKRISENTYKLAVEKQGLIFEGVTYQNKDKKIKRTLVHYRCPKHLEEGIQMVSSDRLLSGKMCGCKKCSTPKGELLIMDYLKDKKIPYIHTKKSNDLRGVNGGMLSYDFYIPSFNLLIEFQGEQHERHAPFFGGNKKSTWNFKKQQEHDRRKRRYASDNNYELLEIWYRDINKISSILDNALSNKNKVVS